MVKKDSMFWHETVDNYPSDQPEAALNSVEVVSFGVPLFMLMKGGKQA